MNKTFINIRRAGLRALVSGFALLALLSFVLPQAAQASTAANTTIRNTVTVAYKDTLGTAMTPVSNTVDILVAFVCAAPTLNAPTDITTQPGTNAVYNYTITASANGPDTYALSALVTAQSAGISGSTVAVVPASVVLGGTTVAVGVTIAAAGTTAISVPNDAASNTSVNGIEAGDTIVIGTAVYTVASITDNGGTVGGTSTITVNGNGAAQVLTVGTIIGERKTFTTTVTPGPLGIPTTADQTITVRTTADGATGSCSVTDDDTITTVQYPKLTVLKEVSANGTSGWTNVAGTQFIPGATVYYRVTVTNTGTSSAASVVLTDAQPLYTTYQSGSAYHVAGLGNNYGTPNLTDTNADGDGYDFGLTTSGVATYSIGTMAAGATVQFFFTVKVDN
jgi:uncharacterized repeat protein (TIGR01451 family)